MNLGFVDFKLKNKRFNNYWGFLQFTYSSELDHLMAVNMLLFGNIHSKLIIGFIITVWL